MRFAALLNEIFNDLQVGHVLARRIVMRCSCYQAALAVDHVGSEFSAADFLQTADKKLQIHDRSDHAQEASAVHDRRANQHDRTRRLAAPYYQGLSVINSAIPSRSVGALQFALQKSVGGDTACRDSLAVGVEQSGISQIFRRGNKIFQQSAKLRCFHMVGSNVTTACNLESGGKICQHHTQRFLVLRNVVGQRARYRVL